MKIAILGFGREGQSVYKFLKKQSSYKKAEFFILDQNTKTKTPKGSTPVLGKKYLDNLKEYDQVFRSPGIPYHLVKKHKNIEGLLRDLIRFIELKTQLSYSKSYLE